MYQLECVIATIAANSRDPLIDLSGYIAFIFSLTLKERFGLAIKSKVCLIRLL
jgi:hypothetical protein